MPADALSRSVTYCDAVAAASDEIADEKGLPTSQKIRIRSALLERAAHAALSYASIQDARVGDSITSPQHCPDHCHTRMIQHPLLKASIRRCAYGTEQSTRFPVCSRLRRKSLDPTTIPSRSSQSLRTPRVRQHTKLEFCLPVRRKVNSSRNCPGGDTPKDFFLPSLRSRKRMQREDLHVRLNSSSSRRRSSRSRYMPPP